MLYRSRTFRGAFLSTPSARRATEQANVLCSAECISIHALREEGDVTETKLEELTRISIHALREEGDADADLADLIFLDISIHALREEGDVINNSVFAFLVYFYPRPPRGGRHKAPRVERRASAFLSTPSARRATAPCCKGADQSQNFYPRPPRGGRHVLNQMQGKE